MRRRRRAKGSPAIVARLVNACWSLFKAGLAIALVAGAAIAVYLYVRMDEEIRRHVETMLAEKFPQLDVSVGSASLLEGKGIALYDLSLRDPRSNTDDDRILEVQRLLLVCNAQVTDLVQAALDVRTVEINHPQVWLRRSKANAWNFESLLPLKPCGKKLPTIVVRDGAVAVVDDLAHAGEPLLIRDIAVSVEPTSAEPVAPGVCPSVRVAGSFDAAAVKRIEFHAEVDGPQQYVTAASDVTELTLDPALVAWVTPYLPEAARSTSIGGIVDGTASLAWRVGGGELPAIDADLALRDGRIENPRLPRPLTEVAARATASLQKLTIDNLRGKCGSATVALSLNRSGWTPQAPLTIAARVENATLDEQLYQALPPILQGEWDKYKPEGIVDATLQASFDGQRWRPTATLSGRRLSFEAEKFPYRLHDGSGTMTFTTPAGAETARLDLDMIGVGGGQPLHIVGQATDPRPGAAGWVEITGSDLDVDKRMIDALQEKPREVVRSLRPAGQFDFQARIERVHPGELPHTKLRLTLTKLAIKYEKFPYALSEIRGVVEAEDNNWTFRDLVSGGKHPVYGAGYLRPAPEGTELSLRFTGDEEPLDDNLFEALPEGVQQAWRQLQPRGQIDLVADVFYKTGQEKPNIRVAIKPRPESATLRPEFFPYLMEKVSGTFLYEDGRVTLDHCRAEHDRTTVETNGDGFFDADGRWEMRLRDLAVDRLTPRADLLAAMPRQLGKLIERLQPTGGFSIHDGKLEFRRADSPIATVESKWEIALECHQTDLQCGIELQNIHGEITLVGQSDGQKAWSSGELDLETATFKGIQFTNVRGPMWCNESQCRLGKWATELQGSAPRQLEASSYGGLLKADAWIAFEAPPRYGAEATMQGVDLNRLVVERFGGPSTLQGKIDATVRLGGQGNDSRSLLARGDVHVREANIYELPLLASLLKMLKTGSSDATAFTASDVQFRVEGNHIYLDQLDFLGDVFNLKGRGYTNFDQQLYLVFYGQVLQGDRLPLLKSMVGHMNESIVQMSVDGTLSAPHVTTEAFPGINKMLQQIRADFESPAIVQPPLEAGRPVGQAPR